MRYVWWDFTYDPMTREVTVRRFAKCGTTWARVEVEYDGLTWGEALDVLDADSSAELRRLLSSVGRLDEL